MKSLRALLGLLLLGVSFSAAAEEMTWAKFNVVTDIDKALRVPVHPQHEPRGICRIKQSDNTYLLGIIGFNQAKTSASCYSKTKDGQAAEFGMPLFDYAVKPTGDFKISKVNTDTNPTKVHGASLRIGTGSSRIFVCGFETGTGTGANYYVGYIVNSICRSPSKDSTGVVYTYTVARPELQGSMVPAHWYALAAGQLNETRPCYVKETGKPNSYGIMSSHTECAIFGTFANGKYPVTVTAETSTKKIMIFSKTPDGYKEEEISISDGTKMYTPKDMIFMGKIGNDSAYACNINRNGFYVNGTCINKIENGFAKVETNITITPEFYYRFTDVP